MVPDSGRDDVADTLASVRAYLPGATAVVVDDRARPAANRRLGSGCVVLPPLPYPRNAYGGLWAKECYAFRWVLANIEVDYVLRLDTDALVLGPGLDEAVVQRFRADPACGALGAYRTGHDGGARDFGPAARGVANEAGLVGLVLRRKCRAALRPLLKAALSNGYELGEHALGAVYALRPQMLAKWQEMGLLDLDELSRSKLGEDWIVGIATKASGYSIGDFAGPGGPLVLSWRGLPASPEELVSGGALATHSLRGWRGRSEAELRRYFAQRRP